MFTHAYGRLINAHGDKVNLNMNFAAIRHGIIGETHSITTPFGEKPLVYADYTASGRSYAPIEDFIRHSVLPLYANTHSESSLTCLLYTSPSPRD